MRLTTLLQGKRGMQIFDVLVIVAIFAVIALITILILKSIYTGSADTLTDRETCKLSVEGHSATMYQVAGVTVTPEIVSIDCKRRLVSIGANSIQVNGKAASYYDGKQNKTITRYDAPSPEVVDAVVADELAGCWYQFLAGQHDFLGQTFLASNRYCFVCSEVTFTPSARAAFVSQPSEPFFDYIKEAQVRKLYNQEQPTLYKYIFNDNTLCYNNLYGSTSEPIPCIEKYLHVYATDWTGPTSTSFLTNLLIGRTNVPLQLSPGFSPQTSYTILFYREGGSWVGSTLDKLQTQNKATYGLTYRPGSVSSTSASSSTAGSSSSTQGTVTYFAWVVDSATLNSNMCSGGYFA